MAKRASDAEPGPASRSSKAPKTDKKSTPAKATAAKGAKKTPKKTAISTSTFKEKALPLHVNITHTPPSIPDNDSVPAAPADPGFLAAITMIPTSFSTGSYGWKGNKKFMVELENESGDTKEKVQVMLNINATVVGSKPAKGDKKKSDDKEKDEEAEDAEDDAGTEGEASGEED